MDDKCVHLSPCPINGGLSVWGDWSACSKSCGDGTKERKRACNNPTPKYNGKPCTESLVLSEKCKVKDCVAPSTVPTTVPTTVPKTVPKTVPTTVPKTVPTTAAKKPTTVKKPE